VCSNLSIQLFASRLAGHGGVGGQHQGAGKHHECLLPHGHSSVPQPKRCWGPVVALRRRLARSLRQKVMVTGAEQTEVLVSQTL
jgi:hypothetical protein